MLTISSFQATKKFDYVKKAMNLNVVDYLVKPVDKVELGHLLEKIVTQLREKVQEPEILSQQLDEEAFKTHLSQKRKTGGLDFQKKNKGILLFLTMF